MILTDIKKELEECPFDKNKYIIISGAALVMHQFSKETSDIDLATTKSFYNEIKWPTKIGACGIEIKYHNNIEISFNLYNSKEVNYIDGYKVQNIKGILKTKKMLNRPKDKYIIEKLNKVVKDMI